MSEAQLNDIRMCGEIVEVYPNRFVVFPKKEEATKSVDKITTMLGFNIIDDIRLTTTTLEDVYVKLCKEKVA